MEPPGETKANVRKPNGETMGNHGRPYENDLHCKWWVFHISWCGYRKVLNFVGFFCCWKRKFLPFNVEGHKASLLDQVQDGEVKAVQNGEALHNN